MPRPEARVIVLLAVAALVALWLALTWTHFPQHKQVPPTLLETAAVERAAATAPGQSDWRQPSHSRARTVASILAGRRNVLEGLTEALSVFGPKDPDLISAAGMATAACGQAQLQAHVVADPRSPLQDAHKLQALEKLQILCEGFDGAAFFKQLDTYEHRVARDGLLNPRLELRLASAQRAIADGVNTFDLVMAGDTLITNKRVPLDQLLGAPAPSQWLQVSGNWVLAAELATCSRQLGCGPDALPTLVICMNLGRCEPGQGYVQALENSLPAEDMRTVLALRQWIARQRR